MQSKKKLIHMVKAKQKQEDSKLLPLKLIWNVNRILPEWRKGEKAEFGIRSQNKFKLMGSRKGKLILF